MLTPSYFVQRSTILEQAERTPGRASERRHRTSYGLDSSRPEGKTRPSG